ncbi:SCO family protein [Candidatus Villigracilis affinis]|uniref:SCO family protein n=1 Tax=Candidatus Villigracilis affinis TaxID=3140682 RepID=UPI001E05B450|nr:SCO family protein [Anaerolineales bacterium]
MKKNLATLIVILLLSSASIWSYQRFALYQFHGSVFQEPKLAAEIVLRSASGPVRLSDYQGKITLLYFGYTSCPDVCPTSLANLKLTLGNLSPEEAAQVQVVFVSVDPARDTPEKLGRYVQMFDAGFIGATGTREEIDLITAAFNVYYKINNSESSENYSVDHSGFITVIDRSGYAVMSWPHGTPPGEMSEDLRYLLRNGMPISAQILAGPTYTPVVCAVTLAPAHIRGGEWLYQHHCAQCHGSDLAGNPAWQVELADGSHLPPPLDGNGKAWQYSEQDLLQIIKEGRSLDKPMYMPAFKNGLADWEINFILTYMKSKWSINQLNYQHGFMTLTPQATQTLVATPSPTNTATP